MNDVEDPSAETDFSVMLRASIVEGMKGVLGVGGTQAILYHLNLPSFDNPRKFHEKLSTIFGIGTAALERVILQQLHQTMGVRPSSTTDDDFVNQVELARRRFDATAKLQRRQ